MYFNNEKVDATNIHGELNSFLNIAGNFFNPGNSEYRSWVSEFQTMGKFLKSLPKDYHEESLTKLVNIFIERVYSEPTKNSSANELFFKLIESDFFAEYLPIVAQNIKREDLVLVMIKNLVASGNIDATIKVTNYFLLPESRHLEKINDTLVNILRNNNRNLIYYFMENYEGWDTRQSVEAIFKNSNLDDIFLDKYFDKIGSFSDMDTAQAAINNLFQRSFPVNRKLDILEKLLNEDRYPYNNNIISFYLKNINDGEFTLDKLKNKDSHFFKILNNVDYMTKWLSQDGNSLSNSIEFFANNNLVSSQTWQEVAKNIIQKSVGNSSSFGYWLKLGTLLNEDCNTRDYQRLLTHNLVNYFFNGIEMYGVTKNQLDASVKINYSTKEFNFQTLEDVFNYFKIFSWSIKDLAKKPFKIQMQLATQILRDIGDASNMIGDINSSLGTPEFEGFIKALKGDSSFQTFFNKYFIDYDFKENSNQFIILTQALKNIKKQDYSLVFDLPENHPLQKLIDNNDITNTKSYWNRDSDAHQRYMSALVNVLGVPSLCVSTGKNNHLVELFKEYKLFPWGESSTYEKAEAYMKTMGKSVKSGWKSWFSSSAPEPLQLVIENGQTQLIFNEAEKIKIDNIPGKQDHTPGSIDDLLVQSQNSLTQLHELLATHSDKDLLLDVKINSENILLENISFLEEIREVSPDINIENMNFLKSNLGKYLLESVNSYIRSVTRYEVMINSNNNGKNSFDINLVEMKNKTDQEELRQLELLAKQFMIVKQSIASQLSEDSLRDMRIRTKILEEHLDHTISQNQSVEGNVVAIVPGKKI